MLRKILKYGGVISGTPGWYCKMVNYQETCIQFNFFQDAVRVYQAVRQLPVLVDVLKKYEGEHRIMIQEVFSKPLEVCHIFKNV